MAPSGDDPVSKGHCSEGACVHRPQPFDVLSNFGTTESGVACADTARVGGAPTIAAGGNEVAGGLCRSTGPPDSASQRGVAAGSDEDDQRECGRGQRTDARHVVAADRGADTPPRTLGATT